MKELPDGTMVENWTSHEVVLYDAEKNREVFIPQEDRAPIRLNTSRVRVSRYLFKVDFIRDYKGMVTACRCFAM